MEKYVAKHKMNHEWQASADEAKALVPAPAHVSGKPSQPHMDAGITGIQRMYDMIEDAGPTPEARLQAAMQAFSINTLEIMEIIKALQIAIPEALHIIDILLHHTASNMKSISYSILNGHKKS